MKIHNLVEDYVIRRVESLYKEFSEKKLAWITCTCKDCKLDVIAYTLNHVSPRYIVSGRGVTHIASLHGTNQLKTDIDVIIMNGIRTISSLQRPYHKIVEKKSNTNESEPSFKFPIFIGNIYDGQTFEPLYNAHITLKYNNSLAPMFDKTWQNPCSTYKATDGTYSFLVAPIRSKKIGEVKNFTFTIEAKLKNYESVTHSFSTTVNSEVGCTIGAAYSLKIQDLFLFQEDKSGR